MFDRQLRNAVSTRACSSVVPSSSERGAAHFGADYLKCNLHIASRRVGVGADFFVRLPHERVQFVLRNVRVLDAHLNGNAKATTLAFADGDGAGNLGLCGDALFLSRHEIKRSPEASSLAGGEKMLRRGQAGPALASKFQGHAEVQFDSAISGFCVAVAAAYRSRRCGKQWVNLVHQISFN
jgi:hypothetical protein